MKEFSISESMYMMSKYYFCYIQYMIFLCFLALGYMLDNKIFIIIGTLQIFLLPNPESYEEIRKRFKK